MSLPTPILDDRTYEQLRDEMLSRISVYLPEWNDIGPGDPGVTLIELVAHLGENILYRFNQIPDQTQLWLLRLLQLLPYPPRQARGLVTFTLSTQATSGPALQGSLVYAGDVPFRLDNDVTVLPFGVTACIKATAAVPSDPILRDEYQRVLDAAQLDENQAQPYQEVVLAPDPDAPGFDALDVHTAVDHALWLAVSIVPVGGGAPSADDQRTALFGAASPLRSSSLVLGFAMDTEYPTIDEIDPCGGFGDRPDVERPAAPMSAGGVTPPSGLVWQVTARSPTDPSLTDYVPVTVVRDTTDGLRRDGVVALQLPPNRLSDIGLASLDDADLAGVDDRPPALADGPAALFWLRVFARDGSPPLRRLRWTGINAADVTQGSVTGPELVGIGSGLGHQDVALANSPVVTGSLRLDVLEGTEWQDWYVVDTFAASRAGDRHVMLDATSGHLRCGEGVRGQVFPAGSQIRARYYEFGGGRTGLVKAAALTKTDIANVTVTNPVPTVGGEDAEPISDALERIPGELSRHDRAVTAQDFRALGKIPGVGRVECLRCFDPTTKSSDAAGVVSVMVWPATDAYHPDAPVPDSALLTAVCAQLDERRLVTTELYVIPPTYRRIGLSISVAVKTGFSELGVRQWVQLVLRQYLSPLPPFGPDGRGWPLGHRVHGPELEAVAVQVDGVDYVEEVKLVDLGIGSQVVATVELQGWEVPELAEITVVQGDAPDPGAGGVQPPPGPAPVPVPVPKDEC
jgi:hypothetical protein